MENTTGEQTRLHQISLLKSRYANLQTQKRLVKDHARASGALFPFSCTKKELLEKISREEEYVLRSAEQLKEKLNFDSPLGKTPSSPEISSIFLPPHY